jgi:hypothetical protein
MAQVIPDYYQITAATNRGLYQATTDIVSDTDKRDVSDVLDLLALADTPFINRIGWGPEFSAQKIEWLSEDLGPGWVATSAAAGSAAGSFIASSAGLAITTAEAIKQIQTGTVLYHYSSTDGDHALWACGSVDAASIGTFALCTDANAGQVQTSIIAGDKIYILGALANEGSLPRTGKWRARALRENYPSILRQDVQISGSMKETDMYAIGGEEMHQIRMRLKEMQRERERLALYGPGVSVRSTTVPTVNKGVFGFLLPSGAPGLDTSTTTLTPSAMNSVVNQCWDYGANNLTFFGDINQCAKFTQWDIDRIRMAPNNNRGGGNITYWMSEAGIEIEIVPMRQVPTNLAFVVDVSKIQLRAKQNRKAIMEKLGKSGDFDDWQIISEFSMEMKGYDHGQHGMFTVLS